MDLISLFDCELNNFLSNNSCISESERFRLEQQRNNLIKKLETVDPALEKAAFDVFSYFNIRGRTFEVKLNTSVDVVIASTIARNVDLSLPCDDLQWLESIGAFGDFGTGSSVESEQNYVLKQSWSQLTASNGALIAAYKCLCNRTSGFYAIERERQRNFGCAITPYGKCTFVPKDTSKYRMVCTEPSLDMFFQRGLATYFDRFLISHFGIDISKQEVIQKKMAQHGSITGELATIDSTSASDSIYLEPLVCCGALSAKADLIFRACKSRVMHYGTKHIKLSMVGTQGCGYTFSFMTLFLASIVEGVYGMKGIPMINGVTFGVYGDDMIVRREAYDSVISAMEMFGLVPNKSKSFNSGPFRESCGGDYYNGRDVRSCYIKRLSTPQHYAIAFNRLSFWASKGPFIPYESLEFLAHKAGLRFVPMYENDYAGLKHPNVRGRYKAWDAKPTSVHLPHIHYDARVQFSIKGFIAGDRALLGSRRDGDSPKAFKTIRKFCYTSGKPFDVGCKNPYTRQYEVTLNRVFLYLDLPV